MDQQEVEKDWMEHNGFEPCIGEHLDLYRKKIDITFVKGFKKNQ